MCNLVFGRRKVGSNMNLLLLAAILLVLSSRSGGTVEAQAYDRTLQIYIK